MPVDCDASVCQFSVFAQSVALSLVFAPCLKQTSSSPRQREVFQEASRVVHEGPCQRPVSSLAPSVGVRSGSSEGDDRAEPGNRGRKGDDRLAGVQQGHEAHPRSSNGGRSCFVVGHICTFINCSSTCTHVHTLTCPHHGVETQMRHAEGTFHHWVGFFLVRLSILEEEGERDWTQ